MTRPPRWLEASELIAFPQLLHSELSLEKRIKSELQNPVLKLDPDKSICRPFLTPSGCPRGSTCPLRHTTPSAANYTVTPTPSSIQGRTVCKHWLRGLCKKDSQCEYLHEYNLRKMPECYFFTRHGFCSSGDECMYLHITPRQRRPECRSYTAGFCRAGKSRSIDPTSVPFRSNNQSLISLAGPDCPNKHIKRVACPLYLVGFCPDGPECQYVQYVVLFSAPPLHLYAYSACPDSPPFLPADVERAAKMDETHRPGAGGAPRDRDRYDGGGGGYHRDNYGGGAAGGGRIPTFQTDMISGDVAVDRGGRAPLPPGRNFRTITCFKVSGAKGRSVIV